MTVVPDAPLDAVCAQDGCTSDASSERVLERYSDGGMMVELVCAVHASDGSSSGVYSGAPSEVVDACRAANLRHSES